MPARGVDVHGDVLLRIFRFQEEELRDDHVGHVALDAAGTKHDPIF
jgi:hypothetical protein